MPRLRDFFRPLGRLLAVVALVVVCGASAVGIVKAQDFDTPATQYPCGVPGIGVNISQTGIAAPLGVGTAIGTQTSWECHWYDFFKELRDGIRRSLAFLVIQGFLNTLTVATQFLAEEAARWVASGFDGQATAFHTRTFGDFLENTANDALNRQIDAFNEGFFKDGLGIDLCQSPYMANIKLSLGFRRVRRDVPLVNCSLDNIRANFARVADSLDTDQLNKTLKQSVEFGGNDLNIALSAQIKVSETIEAQKQAALFDRQESRGFKQVKNFITGNIKLPAEVAIEQVNDASIVKNIQENNRLAVGVMAQQALVAGLKQLPVLAGSTFVSTLAQIGFVKLQDMFKNVQDDAVITAKILSFESDAGAEGGYDGLSAAERRNRAISTFMSDIFRPNLATDEREDLAVSLAACPTPRGLWGCSMDQALATALKIGGSNGALTVGQATGMFSGSTAQGLHPEWELIPEWESQANQDANCYKQAYCSANLAKLRFARILPIGWELAANSPYNQKKNGKYVTLAEVLNGFEKCNAQGQADAANPWCHLVDPHWILTAPPYTCKTRSFTDAVAGDQGVRLRQQECTDVASCLTRDDKGNCTGGYGYCVADKTVWRFGADQCDEKFASCRSYLAPSKKLGAEPGADPSTNQVVSYVRNTVDYGSCNVENTGCLAYAMKLNVPADPNQPATWAGDVGANFTFTAGDGSNLTMPRIYFDKTVKPCSASGEGCTKVLAIEPGASALNLLENSSFELDDASSPTKLKAWLNTVPGIADVQGANYAFAPFAPSAGSASFHGTRAAGFGSTYSALRQIVEAAPQHGYVVSLASRSNGGVGSGSVLVRFAKVQPDGKVSVVNPNQAQFTYSNGCTWTGDGLRTAGSTTGDWQRFTCEFSTPPGIDRLVVSVEGILSGVDAVQLEEGDRATNYIDGLAGSLREDSLKIAPDAYGCTGLATDRPECKKFARVCRQTEAGCQGYTEVGGSGPEIPATLTANDYCPSTCVGYAEYRKLPSAFDLTKASVNGTEVDAADQTSQFFIPARGQVCTAEQAGCEEFTNIESQGEGGEQKAYFRYARACEVPGPASKTFFTWEGSDTAGYQLKTWSLVSAENQGADVPKTLLNAGPDGVVKIPANCNENSWKQGTDPDCRQFYNEAGNVSYVYYSQTIASSALCTSFRKPAPNVDDCVKTGGEYRADQAVCVYKILPSESASCPAAAAGCRAWIGTSGRNASNAVLETFAAGVGAFKAEMGSTVKVSKEALQVGDQSLQVTKSGQGLGGVSVAFDAPSEASLYQVTFWAKAPSGAPGSSGRMTIFARGAGSSVTVSQNTIQLLPEWRRFQAGPFAVVPKDGKAELVLAPAEVDAYIDTVTVQRVQDVAYVKANSWTTPAECDLTAQGIPQPQAMLGCQAYQDRRGTTVAVREFGSLCRFESVGCTAYVDTRNSASPYAESVTLKGGAAAGKTYDNLFAGDVVVTRPGDRYVYLIDEPSAHCAPDQRSCRAFGKPKWNADGLLGLDTPTAKADAASRFETVYLIDDIEKYQKDGELAALCRPSELFCDAFKSGETTSYFRDPGDRVCEWKENVAIDAKTGASLVPAISPGQYAGWFRKGTGRPCYPELLSSAKTFLVHYPAASGYTGQVALCPKDQSECTEFRDPADTSDLNYPQGKPYFFINNQKVDKTTCSKFDPYGLGCVLIRDQSSGNLAYSAKATNRAYLDRGRASVSPIDCTNPRPEDAAYCQGAGTCRNVAYAKPFAVVQGGFTYDGVIIGGAETQEAVALPGKAEGASCSADTDCTVKAGSSTVTVQGKCQLNDTNILAKIKLDRDCSEWMACKAGETVYDESQQKYVTVCTDYGLCSQSSGSTQSAYCRATINRSVVYAPQKKGSDPKPEPVLRQGVFLDASGYASRAVQPLETIASLKTRVGTTQADYSGYSIPNRFQAVDMTSRRIGFDLLTQLGKPEKAKNYADDYRMVAAVPRGVGCSGESVTTEQDEVCLTAEAAKMANNPLVPSEVVEARTKIERGVAVKFVDPKYPTLSLCRHIGTGQIGYYVPGEVPKRCYLAVDTVLTQVVSDAAGSANKRDAQKLADIFDQDPDPRRSIFLQQAAPGIDCRAQPDAGAPFGNEFVKDWDLSVQPPKPKSFVAGYEGVATCERGEDCSCQYAKVSYGNQISKYYELLSRQAPPQGVCQGGPKSGSACIPTVSGGLGDVADLDALVRQAASAEADNPCGTGGTCQALTNSTIVRGIGGYCIQRDTAVTVGDKGRYQCLSWHPQAVLNGTRDVYHFDPQVGYYPPINSGEYFCVAPSYAPASGEPVRAGDDVGAPGSMSSIQYDERCVSANWSALEERAQGFNYYVKYEQQNDDYDEPDEYQVSAAITGSNDPSFVLRRIGKKQPVCTNVDGSDIKKSKAAEHCAALKPVDWVKGNYAYGQQIGDGNIIGDIISLGKGALTNYVDAYLSLIELPDLNLKDVLLQPLQNLWNFGTNLVNIFSCITGQSGCLPQQKTVSSFWGRRVLDRASFAIPGSKLDNPAEDTTDAQTLRMVATGEGTNRSYAEYFIPASSTFGKGDVGMLESQIGYFKLRVPRPGDAAPEYPDEAGWSPKMKAPAVAPDRGPADPQNLPSTDYSHLSRAPSIDRVKDNYRPDKVTDSDWGILWFQANSLVRQDKNVGPVNKTMDWAFFREKDPAKRVKDGGDVGQLGCVMTEKWVDEVADFSDWSTEQQVVQATKQWHQGFQKQFAGLLSRADSGVVKNADGTYLRQLPCASDAKKLCYYRYWQTDYRSAGQDMFGMFDADKNSNLPSELGSKATYFKRAQGSKPYFSIRAMFESQSAEDNAKSPLDQPIDGSGLQGPFKFVGFWVTAAAPGSSDAQHVYMRVSTVDSNACRDVAQVISPKDRSNAAFTDRTWAQGGYIAPSVTANYGTPNIPFGAAIHQKPIGKDPMLMLDVAGGVVDPAGTFVKPGVSYSGVANSRDESKNPGPFQYNLLSNVFARIYKVYHYYELPVKKGDSMCFLGPLMGQRCSNGADCNPNGKCMWPGKDGSLGASASFGDQGVCVGGVYAGRTCTSMAQGENVIGSSMDCDVRLDYGDTAGYMNAIQQSCRPVQSQVYKIPMADDYDPELLINCAGPGDPNSIDPDKDNNRCTHGVGYYPRLDVCPADDLECLVAESLNGSVDRPRYSVSAPVTDVTPGHYALSEQPGKLYSQEGLPRVGSGKNVYGMRNRYVVEAYIPKAPRVAAPDTSRQCPSPGQCPIARMDAISVEGAAEGPIILYGDQANVTTRFYAWSADNQAPIASLWVDWSDGVVQKTDGARIKNAKPFCGVGRQCEFAPGLSCVSDADCPTGAGKCFDTGVCSNDSGKSCFYNADCGDAASTCVKRLTYGNSPDACEPNYREFTHAYDCSQTAIDAGKIPACSGSGVANGRSCYISNVEGLTCRFVPRVYVKDNWGWCTGNCTKPAVSGDPTSVGDISLRFAGGCYDGSKAYLRTDSPGASTSLAKAGANYCDPDDLSDTNTPGSTPWLPYKGYVELRAPKK